MVLLDFLETPATHTIPSCRHALRTSTHHHSSYPHLCANPALFLDSTHWTSPALSAHSRRSLIPYASRSSHTIPQACIPHPNSSPSPCPDPYAGLGSRLPNRTIISPKLIGPLSTSGRTSESKTGQLACDERASRRTSIDHIRRRGTRDREHSVPPKDTRCKYTSKPTEEKRKAKGSWGAFAGRCPRSTPIPVTCALCA